MIDRCWRNPPLPTPLIRAGQAAVLGHRVCCPVADAEHFGRLSNADPDRSLGRVGLGKLLIHAGNVIGISEQVQHYSVNFSKISHGNPPKVATLWQRLETIRAKGKAVPNDRMLDYIKERMELRGMTQTELARALDMTPPNISKKLNGVLRIDAAERAQIAKALGHRSMVEFDEAWRASNPVPQQPRKSLAGRIPVINAAPAGVVASYDGGASAQAEAEDAWEYIDRDEQTLDGRLFAVRVVGDSMEPNLLTGDHLVFLPLTAAESATLEDGRIVFVRLSQDAPRPGVTVGRAYRVDGQAGKWRISKDNRKYADIHVDREHVEQLAVAVQRRTVKL
jgi:SOS-response transcriptional repressor LexA